jgi:hypothetical protein
MSGNYFLQPIGKLDGEIGALAQLPKGIGVLIAGSANPFEWLKQPIEILCQQLLAIDRIPARLRELVLRPRLRMRRSLKNTANTPNGKSVVRSPVETQLDRTGVEVSFGPISACSKILTGRT